MLTFEDAYEYTKKIGSHTSYDVAECRLLFNIAMRTPDFGRMLEIGCEYGRSTSLLIQVAKWKGAALHLVEPDPKPELIAMLRTFEHPFILYVGRSDSVYGLPDEFQFLHIDGNHDYESVFYDLKEYVPKTDGYIVCHDYQRESLPDVTRAIDDFRSQFHHLTRLNDKAETALCLTTL